MQPFNSLPICQKCLSREISMALLDSHLQLVCKRCGHTWEMKTADHGDERNKEDLIMEEKK